MDDQKHALLLIGSPKGEKSTSASVGNYLLSKLEAAGMSSEKAYIHKIENQAAKIQELFETVDQADLIILSFPLYVDSLPAPVIKAMELLKEKRGPEKPGKSQSLIAICNNGFPEPAQNTVALEICRNFSQQCGFIWRGGISIGGGGVSVNGIPLNKKKRGLVKDIIRGLESTAKALKNDQDIPETVLTRLSKAHASAYLYLTLINLTLVIHVHRKLILNAGMVFSLLGIPMLIFGALNDIIWGENFGRAFIIIGLNLVLQGWIHIMISKGNRKHH